MQATTFFTGAYLTSDELASGEQALTIRSVEPVEFKDKKTDRVERKLQLVFDDGRKLNLNKTNGRALMTAFGADTDAWSGQTVVVYFDGNVTYGGKRIGGIRIKAPAAAQLQSRF